MYYLKSKVEVAFYEKHIEGGHVTREHKGLSPMRVRSGSEVTTKEGPKRKTKETYYKVQTVTLGVRTSVWSWNTASTL